MKKNKSQSMLDAKDLRIGNLATNAGGIIIKITPEKISDLSNKLIILNPIELTEEWLLRFGFEQCKRYSIKKKSNLIGMKRIKYDFLQITANGFNFKFQTNFSEETLPFFLSSYKEYSQQIDIRYVHELQNLYYALTQTELTLKETPATND